MARHPGASKTKAVEAAIANHVSRGRSRLAARKRRQDRDGRSLRADARDRPADLSRVVLPDTSVWVDFARRGARGRATDMRSLLDAGEVATCGPVAAELLAVAAARAGHALWCLDSDFERIRGTLDALELYVPAGTDEPSGVSAHLGVCPD